MTEPKFTPGPWQVNGSHIYTADPERALIAQVFNSSEKASDYPLSRNAHLIAAAPDLYRELELARFTIAMEIATMGPRTLGREEKEALIAEHPAIKSIDAALAKARGESHD